MKDTRNDFLPYITTVDGRLHNLSYKLIAFKDREKYDHAHCDLCWVTIEESERIGIEREGYYCEETGCWLCKKCFLDFAQRFGWYVTNEKDC